MGKELGETLEERGELMRPHPAPPVPFEKIVSLLIPPASREEVLGDLCERCTSTGHYVGDALRVLPGVILSRVRRTTDPQVLLMEAVILYSCYVASAWRQTPGSLYESFVFLRLVIPCVLVLFGVIVEDAYAKNSGKRSLHKLARGPIAGVGFAYLAHVGLLSGKWPMILPPWVMFYGSAISLLFIVTLRFLFAHEWRTKP